MMDRMASRRATYNHEDPLSTVQMKGIFDKVKTFCVQLSQETGSSIEAEISTPERIEALLSNINEVLKNAISENFNLGLYSFPTNLADYIFFPISQLIGKCNLTKIIKLKIAETLSLLTINSWSYSSNYEYLEQIGCLLINILNQTGITNRQDEEIGTVMVNGSVIIDFKDCIGEAIYNIIMKFPDLYFQKNSSQLPTFGLFVTFELELLMSIEAPASDTEVQSCIRSIASIKKLFSLASPLQASKVLPGTISKLVRYFCMNANLHYRILVSIIDTLGQIISHSFNDKLLKCDESTSKGSALSFSDLALLADEKSYNADVVNEIDDINGPSIKQTENQKGYQSDQTGREIEKALALVFKKLLSTFTYRSKIKNRPELTEAIIKFFAALIMRCYKSLFQSTRYMFFDVLSNLMSIRIDERSDLTHNLILFDDIFTKINSPLLESKETEKLIYLHDSMEEYLSELIKYRLGSIFLSTDEDKIHYLITSFQMISYLINKAKISLNMVDKNLNFKIRMLISLKEAIIDAYTMGNKKGDGEQNNSLVYTSPQVKEDTRNETEIADNKLDGIELPTYIDSSKIVHISAKRSKQFYMEGGYSDMLSQISANWRHGINENLSSADANYFKGIFSFSIEKRLSQLFSFLISIWAPNEDDILYVLERLFDSADFIDSRNSFFQVGLALWISNNLLQGSVLQFQNDQFSIDHFLIIDDGNEENQSVFNSTNGTNYDEILYLFSSKLDDVFEALQESVQTPQSLSRISLVDYNMMNEMSFSAALDAFNWITKSIPLEKFREVFMIQNLYRLFEALTYQNSSMIPAHAYKAINSIAEAYYGGDLAKLIEDNKDYLIDSIGVKLSVARDLNPSIGGVLFLVSKISGLELLLSSKFSDIFSMLFVLIDTYHGYSTLVEVFFMVFNELIEQVRLEFCKKKELRKETGYFSWDLKQTDDLLDFLAQRNVENGAYEELESEGGFEDLKQKDSDDEGSDESDEEIESKSNDTWTCNIPKQIYLNIQKVFIYGTRLLSHPSLRLRLRILDTLKSAFVVLSYDYQLCLPLIPPIWSNLIIQVVRGDRTKKMENILEHHVNESVSIKSLEMMIILVQEDRRNADTFLASKFKDFWLYFTENSDIYKKVQNKRSLGDPKSFVNLQLVVQKLESENFQIKAQIRDLYISFIAESLTYYRKTIPDRDAYRMVKFCDAIGINPELELSFEFKNILWVIQKKKSIH